MAEYAEHSHVQGAALSCYRDISLRTLNMIQEVQLE